MLYSKRVRSLDNNKYFTVLFFCSRNSSSRRESKMKNKQKHHTHCPHRAQTVIEKKYLVYWIMINVHILHFQRCQNNWIWTCSLVINKYKQDNICKTIHRYHTTGTSGQWSLRVINEGKWAKFSNYPSHFSTD